MHYVIKQRCVAAVEKEDTPEWICRLFTQRYDWQTRHWVKMFGDLI